MEITYFRSSSYNRYDMCPMQFYIEYVLGWRGSSGLAADKGTICHKVLEVMALCKKAKQEKKRSINDEICGIVDVKKYDINKLTEQVYKYYSKHNDHHNWTEKHFKDCKNWVWKALQYNDGQFDPRNRDVVDAEPAFDIEIAEPWAMYETEDGSTDFLRIKGTIDLITKVKPGVLEIIDWKSGQYRKDWATGKTKELEDFEHDPQLRMYHYAAHKMYDVDTVMATIFYINAGGPFTVCLDKDELPKTEEMLRKQFELIKQDNKPGKCPKDNRWQCTKFCHFGKNTFEGTHIKPQQNFTKGSWNYGETMTMCEQLMYETYRKGIEKTTAEHTAPGHNLNHYQDPGAV